MSPPGSFIYSQWTAVQMSSNTEVKYIVDLIWLQFGSTDDDPSYKQKSY